MTDAVCKKWMIQQFISLLCVSICVAAQGQQQRPGTTTGYQAAFNRGLPFVGRHCVSPNATSAADDEIFLLRTDLSDWTSGKARRVEVAEFFSGKHYEGEFTPEQKYGGTLSSHERRITLDCAHSTRAITLGRDQPIGPQGAYLTVLNVGPSGEYGEDVAGEVCQAGAHCDIGTQGLALVDAKGAHVWANLITIRDKRARGHPTYLLPHQYRIDDGRFTYATRLLDGTALMTFDMMTIRISLDTEEPVERHPDVAVVNLKEWSQLKKILNDRWLRARGQCPDAASALPCNHQRRTELYFYTLRDYLYPND